MRSSGPAALELDFGVLVGETDPERIRFRAWEVLDSAMRTRPLVGGLQGFPENERLDVQDVQLDEHSVHLRCLYTCEDELSACGCEPMTETRYRMLQVEIDRRTGRGRVLPDPEGE